MWISALLVTFMLGSFLMALANQYLVFRDRTLHTGAWSAGWVVLGFHFAADLWNQSAGGPIELTALKDLLEIGGLGLMTWGTNKLVGVRTPWNWSLFVTAMALSIPVLVLAEAPIQILLTPDSLLILIAFLYMSRSIIITGKIVGAARILPIILLVISAVVLPVARIYSVIPDWKLTSYIVQGITGLSVTVAVTISHLVIAREEQRQKARRTQLLLDHSSDMAFVFSFEPKPGFSYVSPAIERLLGFSASQLLEDPTLPLKRVHPDDSATFRKLVRTRFEHSTAGTLRWVHPNGNVVFTEHRAVPIRDARGHITAIEGIIRDVTQRQRLEEKLNRANKLEALGRLAGGIAHDFNNLLGVIIGAAERLESKVRNDPEGMGLLRRILDTGTRSQRLTDQLLVFGKRKPRRPRKVDWNKLLSSLEPLLDSLVGKNVQTIIEPSQEPALVLGDPSQLEQLLLNLVVNAREAMPEGGLLSIRSRVTTPEPQVLEHHSHLRAVPHLFVHVRDSGTGIPREILEFIFDPFFTTKPEGTGLGLSTTYAVVQQMDGAIEVQSEPGKGTTFQIYLPLASDDAETTIDTDELPVEEKPITLEGTVLVVDDEPFMLEMVCAQLDSLGFDLRTAGTAEEALELASRLDPPPRLLVSDVVLPGASGPELARQLQLQFPDLKVLFISGFPGKATGIEGLEEAHLLPKPFRHEQLKQQILSVLGESSI